MPQQNDVNLADIFSPLMAPGSTAASGEACLIIAEAGVNHNGRLDLAYELIRQAKQVGANAIKFQLFNPQSLTSHNTPLAGYQNREDQAIASQQELLAPLSLPQSIYPELKRYAESQGLLFLCSPFDEASADFLVNDCGVQALKLASGEITNLPFLEHIKRLQVPVILSTGMCSMSELRNALAILDDSVPLCLLHCVSAYPTPLAQSNLLAIQTLRQAFPEHGVGYSDHTQGIEAAIIARSLGAQVVEKHLTLDNTMSGPDHATSLNPDAFAAMVQAIRQTEAILGTGIKQPQPCEADCIRVARRSLVAKRDLPVGHLLQASDLTCKRPATGISPMQISAVVGQRIQKPVPADTVLEMPMLAQALKI